MTSRADPGGADPDGYSGLSRRGPYERLGLTEWVLADALPDEFLRRAVMGEHLFLEIDRRTPASGRQCIVLLDGGPDQLGGPRIGQLALLVVLARRAAEAGAALRWGVVQSEVSQLHVLRDRVGFRVLLAGRSAADPDAEQIRRWREAAGPLGPDDELWMVGGRTMAALADRRSAWVCRIDEDPFSDDEALEVDVTRPGASGRRVQLPLPPVAERVRLIREPFGPPPASVAEPSRHRRGFVPDLRFSSEGERLLVREEDGACVAFRVQAGKVRKPGRQGAEGEGIRAVGWSGQHATTVSTHEGGLVLRSGGHRFEVPAAVVAAVGPVDFGSDERWTDVVRFRTGWWVFLAGGTLWSVTEHTSPPLARFGPGHCLAFTRRDGQILAVFMGIDGTRISQHRHPLDVRDLSWPYTRASEAHIGPCYVPGPRMVLRIGPDRWLAPATRPEPRPDREQPASFTTVDGERVFGLTATADGPALLVGRAASLVLRPPDGGADILLVDAPVLAASASSGTLARVAWMTQDRRVVAYDVLGGVQIFELLPSDAP